MPLRQCKRRRAIGCWDRDDPGAQQKHGMPLMTQQWLAVVLTSNAQTLSQAVFVDQSNVCQSCTHNYSCLLLTVQCVRANTFCHAQQRARREKF
eukprot:2421416-Amphidinium_carterae.1